MGIVPETSNVYDDLSAWRNLMFSAELYGIGKSAREKKGQELLEMFGLWSRKDDKARGYSKGMKRRLTLAMGLINEPAPALPGRADLRPGRAEQPDHPGRDPGP